MYNLPNVVPEPFKCISELPESILTWPPASIVKVLLGDKVKVVPSIAKNSVPPAVSSIWSFAEKLK